MHSIERYGIVALLFLVVTVVAVLMWDGGKDEKKKDLVGTVTTPPAAKPALDTLEDPAEAAARRLSLVADSQPGPLQRRPLAAAQNPEAQNPAAQAPGAQPLAAGGAQGAALEDPSAHPETLDASAVGPETLPTQSQREQPAPEQVVGKLEAGATTHTYLVRSGDTLSEIAQRELGSSRRWQEIVAANPGLDPAKLGVGKKIQIPGGQSGGASAPTLTAKTGKPVPASSPKAAPEAGRGTWKVGKGENLWKIAAQTLGDGKRWGEIAKLNPGVNPDRLTAGLVLKLPAGAAGAAPQTAAAKTTPKSGAPSSASKVAKDSSKKSTPTLVASNTGSERARRGGKVK